MKVKHSKFYFIAVVVALVSVSRVYSAEVIYEPFDYAAGNIDGTAQSGGTGMTGAWTTTGTDNLYDIQSSGLSFSNLKRG